MAHLATSSVAQGYIAMGGGGGGRRRLREVSSVFF